MFFMIVDHCPALDNLAIIICPLQAYWYVAYMYETSNCMVLLQ